MNRVVDSDVFDAVNHLFSFPENFEKLMFHPRSSDHTTNEIRSNSIPVDILDAPKDYVFYMDVPGLSKSDIQVRLINFLICLVFKLKFWLLINFINYRLLLKMRILWWSKAEGRGNAKMVMRKAASTSGLKGRHLRSWLGSSGCLKMPMCLPSLLKAKMGF